MKTRGQASYALLLLAGDMAMIFASVALAYYLRFHSGIMSFKYLHSFHIYRDLALVEVFLFPMVFALRDMYRFRRNVSRIDELQTIFASVSAGTLFAWAIAAFLFPDNDYARALILIAWLLAVVLVTGLRFLIYSAIAAIMRTGRFVDRVLLVGTGELGQAILSRIEGSPALGYRVAGFAQATAESGGVADVNGYPILGTADEVGDIVRRYDIDDVIIAEPSLTREDVLGIMDDCESRHVSIRIFPDIFQLRSSQAYVGDLNGLPMISVRDTALRGWKLMLKRAVDLIVAAIVLVLFSPVMLLIALLIKATSPRHPVFYVQERVGMDNKPFKVLKFRSMRPDAESRTGPVWADRGDPRVTSLGKFLRRSSLDELPQFVNVLLGEMSVVGPRPERPYFVEQFGQRVARYHERHREKVGLTGWAQVNGMRGNVNIEERTAYDLWYTENWTLWLDFKIMLRTIISILKHENAY